LTKEELKRQLNSKNVYGNTPLLELMSGMQTACSIVSRLIDFGADVNLTNSLGMSPLYKSVEKQFIPGRLLEGEFLGEFEKDIVENQTKNDRDVMFLLLNAGALVNQADVFGRTPLFGANDPEVLSVLLEHGADLNTIDNSGRSVLHSALSMPNGGELLNYFISKLDTKVIHKSDIYGSTIAHYASLLGYDDVLQDLQKNGVDMTVRDSEGNTPLDIMKRKEEYWKAKGETKKVHFKNIIENEDHLEEIIHHTLQTQDITEVILQKPGIGAPFDEKESKTIVETVMALVQNICNLIPRIDDRLKCTILRTGSTAEGTKAGDPNEYDFVFCLDGIANICRVSEDRNKTGFAELESNGDMPDSYSSFFDDRNKIKAPEVRCAFSKVLQQLVLDRKTWSFPHIFFNGEIRHLEEYDRPVFTLKLRWIGCTYKDEEISLDIVPAVRIEGWWPADIDFNSIDMMTDDIKKEGCLLLLQNPYFQSETLLTISCAPAEICLMKSLPSFIRESYRLCKLLRHRSVCPLMDPDSTFDEFPLFKAEDCITSYMLKNSLFHVLRVCKQDNILAICEPSQQKSATTIVAIHMLNFLIRCVESERLPVYLMPNRDVFTFDFVESDNLSDTELHKFNNFHCTRRRAFLKIMLHLLGHK
jgi:hypothetical protein